MKIDLAHNFIKKHQKEKSYQPIIFMPGVLEVQGKWHDATLKMADLILFDCEGKSVFDVGCNIGFFLREADKRGASKVSGIDLDPYVIDRAKEIDTIFENNTHCTFGSIEDCNDPKDIVLAMNILHVIYKPQEFIEKALSLAKEKLIMEVENSHLSLFQSYNIDVLDSPRACGHRKLLWITI